MNELLAIGIPVTFLTLSLFLIFYKINRKGDKILTLQNISLFSIFIGVSIGLSFLSITIIPNALSISFDLIPLMLLGFLLGPIEGMTFGFFVDTIFTLIKGWQWLPIYALTKPTVGLISGIIGNYSKKENKREWIWYEVLITQLLIIASFIAAIILINVQDSLGMNTWTLELIDITPETRKSLNIAFPTTFVLFEVVYIYLIYKLSKEQIAYLNYSSLIVLLIALFTSYGFNSIGAQIYYGVPYQFSALSRVFSNIILLPLEIYFLYILIGYSPYLSNILTNSKNKW